MRIVSQNREYSADIDRVVLMVEYNSIICSSWETKRTLGRYKSEERARAVFDEIHKYYSPLDVVYCGCEFTADQIRDLGLTIPLRAISTSENVRIEVMKERVYYMPEE